MKPMNAISLVGVIHLPPLLGAPAVLLKTTREIAREAANEARLLHEAGYDACIVENYGDAPFARGAVEPYTVAAMTAIAASVRDAVPDLPLGINVLRNDAAAALSIAAAVEAQFIRVNVHVGARVADQGIIQGDAAHTLRLRKALEAQKVDIWADADVKHSAPLAPYDLEQEVSDLVYRGGASAVLVTGSGTGHAVDLAKLERVKKAAHVPVYIASGATPANIGALVAHADGVIVGSALRKDSRAGAPIDAALAKQFATAFRSAK